MAIKSKSDRDRIRQRSAKRKRGQYHKDEVAERLEASATKKRAGLTATVPRTDIKAETEWRRQMEMKIVDTRDYTGRAFGDPIQDDPRRPWLNRTASI